MDDTRNLAEPAILKAIAVETQALGFEMASDSLTGSLLRTLAASRVAGVFLELGTGTGLSAAWILEGMDRHSTLVSVDNDPPVVAVAERHLGHDNRVRFHVSDGAEFLRSLQGQTFDFIFADTWPGKYDHLEEALALLKPGGIYIIDDMLPQPNWPEGHDRKVSRLIATLEACEKLFLTKLHWSTGLIVCTRR